MSAQHTLVGSLFRLIFAVVALGLAIAPTTGCEKSQDADKTTAGAEELTNATEQAQAQSGAVLPPVIQPEVTHTVLTTGSETSPGWTVLDARALSANQQAQLATARAAQADLGERIRKRLDAELETGGYTGAFSICQCATRPLCEGVGLDHKLEIGRTSFLLRNGDNKPPVWASPVVNAASDVDHIFQGPDEKLALITPIWLDDVCVGCHGTDEALASGVPELLAESFPRDQARGFDAGGLRGYVWVEVPLPAPPETDAP